VDTERILEALKMLLVFAVLQCVILSL